MRHHAWVSDERHVKPASPLTLGWMQFTLILIVILAVLLLTGAIIPPF